MGPNDVPNIQTSDIAVVFACALRVSGAHHYTRHILSREHCLKHTHDDRPSHLQYLYRHHDVVQRPVVVSFRLSGGRFATKSYRRDKEQSVFQLGARVGRGDGIVANEGQLQMEHTKVANHHAKVGRKQEIP